MTNRTAATAAIILSLAAAGAPAASAMPMNDGPVTKQAPASLYSRADKSMIPAASHGGGITQATASVYSRADKSMIPVGSPRGAGIAPATAPQPVVHVQTPQGGFDWGDAGIGAAVVAMAGIGGAFAASQRRSRRTTVLPN